MESTSAETATPTGSCLCAPLAVNPVAEISWQYETGRTPRGARPPRSRANCRDAAKRGSEMLQGERAAQAQERAPADTRWVSARGEAAGLKGHAGCKCGRDGACPQRGRGRVPEPLAGVARPGGQDARVGSAVLAVRVPGLPVVTGRRIGLAAVTLCVTRAMRVTVAMLRHAMRGLRLGRLRRVGLGEGLRDMSIASAVHAADQHGG